MYLATSSPMSGPGTAGLFLNPEGESDVCGTHHSGAVVKQMEASLLRTLWLTVNITTHFTFW